MKLFITSYPKSGTHQIMPPFIHLGYIIDYSHNSGIDVPERFGMPREIDYEGIERTIDEIKGCEFDRAFGHVSYRPEYAELFRSMGTKVIFNIRDPRDIVVSQLHKRTINDSFDADAEMMVFEKGDPIPDLIEINAAKLHRWLGWMDEDFVFVNRYENLRLKPEETMQSIIDWLDPYTVNTFDNMVSDLSPRPKNPTFRRGVPGEWITTFSKDHMRLSDKYFGELLERMGYS